MGIEIGIGLEAIGVNKQSIDKMIEKVMSESPVWKKYAEEYANKFALEKRLPLKEEYFEMMVDIGEKVMEQDESIRKKVMFAVISETILNEDLVASLKKEFKDELEEQQKAKDQNTNTN